MQWSFCQAPCEEVNVVDVSVGPPQSLDHRGSNLAAEPLKVVSPGEFRMLLNENLAGIRPTLSCTNPQVLPSDSCYSCYLHKMSEI